MRRTKRFKYLTVCFVAATCVLQFSLPGFSEESKSSVKTLQEKLKEKGLAAEQPQKKRDSEQKKQSFLPPVRASEKPISGKPLIFKIDPVHSSINFKVRHLVSVVTGSFTKFEGTIEIHPDPADSRTEVIIDAASVNTHNEKRDGHLKSEDFLDVQHFTQIKFKSKRVVRDQVFGDLTIRGLTRETVLTFVMNGGMLDAEGKKRLGFSATTKIDRSVFGILYNKTLPTGQPLIGDEVPIEIFLEVVQLEESKT